MGTIRRTVERTHVTVIEPKIDSLQVRTCKDGTFCLYDWLEEHWQKQWHMHETIIPWTSEWLVFYEIWLLTGKWRGRSADHVSRKVLQRTRSHGPR